MEVHHSKKQHGSGRKFAEYFQEFLMLFFAVFLGFMAENFREHSVERAREKEYVHSFIQNVETDTAQLNARIKTNAFRIRMLDSLLALKKKNVLLPENARAFYQYYILGTFFPKFRPSDATIIQLKNAGGLRLIQRNHAADSIIVYDANNKLIEDQSVFYQAILNETWDAVYPIMDVTIARDTSFVKNKLLTEKELPPLIINAEKLQFFYGVLFRQILIAEVYDGYLKTQLQYAERLLPFLKKEYGED